MGEREEQCGRKKGGGRMVGTEMEDRVHTNGMD